MKDGSFYRAFRRFRSHRLALAAAVALLLFLVAAVFAPLLAPHDPIAIDDPGMHRYIAPSAEHPMGTDKLGRDLLSRLLYGARLSLATAIVAVLLASFIGLLAGAFSGYLGGWVDELLMRLVDGLLSFPRLLLVITLLAFFANSFWSVVLLLAATGWMGVARLVRADVISLKESDFVKAAVASGAGRSRVVLRHLVPNTMGTVVVAATLRVGAVILLESYLSFLGIGVQPPNPSWGAMVFEGREALSSAWWVSFFPGLCIVLCVMACNLLGDGLRDAIDVKSV